MRCAHPLEVVAQPIDFMCLIEQGFEFVRGARPSFLPKCLHRRFKALDEGQKLEGSHLKIRNCCDELVIQPFFQDLICRVSGNLRGFGILQNIPKRLVKRGLKLGHFTFQFLHRFLPQRRPSPTLRILSQKALASRRRSRAPRKMPRLLCGLCAAESLAATASVSSASAVLPISTK